ncbi:hypothetical protein G6O69_00675 [Pseudenhygromyxa sp. WMMC2535]|uniref:hypothetical protein n=1 Tax=Pseudenhygromyxa sp. WMMC2535 TaxID=2712867 RepID=UPI0015519D77|nr:hypothetical protein [Pseudenhygromyxa sp. WMMC2535]NVB36324.1 hypothetical protein [Pseudenhygromyxa sp. WMMC2535]
MTAAVQPSLEDPKDSWLVYADALQAAGDPRGELIALSQAIEDGASPGDRDALFERHAEAIFGSLAAHRAKLEIDWKWCVPRTLSVLIDPDDDVAAVIAALLASPLATQMQTLRLVARTPNDEKVELGPAVAALAEGLPENCTDLELVDERASKSRIIVSADYSPDENLVDFGELEALWRIPQLRKLHLVVADMTQVPLGEIDAPALEDFSFLGLRWGEGYSIPSETAEPLIEASWPKLRRLALRLPETLTYAWPEQDGAYVESERYDDYSNYYEQYEDDEGWHEDYDWAGELRGLLAALKQTEIESLSLTSFASASNLLEALEAGLPPTLVHLDLSGSDLGDDHVAWMVEHAEIFERLQTLDLRDTLIHNPSPLAALEPEVLHSDGGGAAYRFAVGME